MKAMILAAGRGTRLRPFTDTVPKCMIPIGGQPIIGRTVAHLAKHGIDAIVINLSYLPRLIMDYLGDGSRWGVKITYSLEREALGTGGGVKNVAGFFDDGPFVIWYGDNSSGCDLDRAMSFHLDHGGMATMALVPREDVSQSGIVGLDADDRIVRFMEKPRCGEAFSHWVNAGIYILEPAVLDYISPQRPQDFGRDVFPTLLSAGQNLYGYRLSPDEGLWWIDTPNDLQRVREEWQRREGIA